jgi:UV DNA damage repair endonuclease
MRLGFCCKYLHPDRNLKPKILKETEQPLNCRSTTVRWLNEHKPEAEEKLWDLMRHNISSIHELIKYTGSLPKPLRMCRISSPVLPVATEATWKYFWSKPDVINYCEKHFAEVGKTARNLGVRLSFHPGQFTVLASESDDIINRSIEEFEYHVNMARWMGYGRTFQDFKINVHISGRRGPQGIIDVMSRLTPEARNTLTIENEEMKWGLDDILKLEKHVALVFDIHHHWVNCGEWISANDDRIKRIIDSWRGVRPAMHYSQPRELLHNKVDASKLLNREDLFTQGENRATIRAHSDYYWHKPTNDWVKPFGEYFDIQCESKAKNLASAMLAHEYKLIKTGSVDF